MHPARPQRQAAVEPKAAQTFAVVVENWRKRHVEANGLRSAREINRLLEVHVLPHCAIGEFTSIGRGDIARLLDGVQDRTVHGRRTWC